MKKRFLFLIALIFLLSGCSQNKYEEISVNNPYEIAKGTSTLSYYDTENNISVDGFNIVENNLQNFQDKNDNIIVNGDGAIRCITVVNDTVKTFQSISVGDSTEKIEESFDNEYQNGNNYMVLFNNDIEEDPTNANKEDSWIWITYFTYDNKVTSIQIYDVKYGREIK
jgi:PBP1b-binding outer membrane lipoprotein LpoB